MTILECSLALGVTFLALLNLASIGVADRRLRRQRPSVHAAWPEVSIIVPLKGVEAFSSRTIRAAFALTYPHYELIFCVAEESDPIVPFVREAMDAHAARPARLLFGQDFLNGNPKLNNCVKGWDAARHQWVLIADSNVLMPQDFVQQFLTSWKADSGLVCSPPIGTEPHNFWAEVECAFLNTMQGRWQYAAEAFGFGFAQGKSMLFNKPLLEKLGGFQQLAAEIAEDAAATKLMRGAGLKVHLAHTPFQQPIGRRSAAQVWSRQARWARLRCVTFPLFYTPEILAPAGVPSLVLLLNSAALSTALIAIAAGCLVANYGAEIAMARANGWFLSWRQPLAMLVRDAMAVGIWIRGWLPRQVSWHGSILDVRRSQSLPVKPLQAS